MRVRHEHHSASKGALISLRLGVTAAFTILFTLAAVVPAHGQSVAPPDARPSLRILFIGNSYTYYNRMPSMVSALAAATPGARPVEVKDITVGGATLEKLRAMQQTQAALADETWDYVILQEQSNRPITQPERMRSAITALHAAITKTGARTLLYVTWAKRKRPQEQTTLSSAYLAAATSLPGTQIAPVGPAWSMALRRNPDLQLYDGDGSHPSRLGSYLAACVIFLTTQPGQASCPDIGVTGPSMKTRQLLESAAREAVRLERSGAIR
ncbi:MAG: SGNH/GDSL hydrolase family protein [Cyanobacteriota bacterium]